MIFFPAFLLLFLFGGFLSLPFLLFSAAVCRLCGVGVLCVSWAVERVGVWCCGHCAPAGAGLCLRCVFRCSLSGRALCVLYPVLLRVSAGAVLATFLFLVLPLMPCLCPLMFFFSGACCLSLRLGALGGCPVAPGLVVLFRLALVSVVLVSLLWCFVPLWGAVWCCPPPRVLCE